MRKRFNKFEQFLKVIDGEKKLQKEIDVKTSIN